MTIMTQDEGGIRVVWFSSETVLLKAWSSDWLLIHELFVTGP